MSQSPFQNDKPVRGLSPFRGARAASLIPNARISGTVSWVIAIMVALTVIAAAGALALGNLAERASNDLSGAFTVQIIDADPVSRQARATQVEQLLQDDPAIASLRVVPREELAEMLEPWLGNLQGQDAVPIPALIDVQLADEAGAQEIDRLKQVLGGNADDLRIDAQSSWLQPVYDALASLQYLAIALIFLLAFIGAAAVWLAARTAFENHRKTIEIVHHLGGTDEQISRIFQRAVAQDAAMGGVIGLAAGLICALIIGRQFVALDSGMITSGGLGLWDWVLVAIIPVFAVVLAIVTARSTVMNALRRML